MNSAAAGKTMVLFGATGNTGKYFLPAALAAGWRVTAFLRTPSKVADAAGLTKVKGDLTKPADVADVVQGADVVVCLAGVPRGTKPGGRMDGFMTKAMKDIVAAMEQHGVRRLMFQVGGFTLLQGEPKTGCFAACCIRDCVLGKCMGESVSLRENQVIAEFLETKRATIDWTLKDGVREIEIEQRSPREVTHMTGRTDKGDIVTVEISAPGSAAVNYGFDVTPARFVTGLITERGVAPASREGLLSLYPEKKAGNKNA